MNAKKFFIAFLAAFVFVFLYEFVFHGIILKESYAHMSAMMRPQTEVSFPLLIVGQLVGAFFFTMIFVRGFGSGGGAAGGFRFGLLVGLFLCGGIIISYAVQPLTGTLAVAWCIGGIIESAITGTIVGALYKP